jgi:hypothetical protein
MYGMLSWASCRLEPVKKNHIMSCHRLRDSGGKTALFDKRRYNANKHGPAPYDKKEPRPNLSGRVLLGLSCVIKRGAQISCRYG